jgi:methanogenic corrinoid protein MtbC1/DNA-binding XRE family transcriptional regulator
MKTGDGAAQEYCEKYLKAILQGSCRRALDIVDDAFASGLTAIQIYLDVVAQAQIEVGDYWAQGLIGVAEEHRATEISMQVLVAVRRRLPHRPPLDLTAVVAAVEGEQHVLGARIFADFLMAEGWVVDFLGAAVPFSELAEFCNHRQPDLLGLSVTIPKYLEPTRSFVQELAGRANPPEVIVGGMAVERWDEKSFPEEVVAAVGALDGLGQVREVFGLSSSQRWFRQFLQALGQQIRMLRREQHWSQQELAERAGIDRTYVSGLERGVQNPSLEVLNRVCSALGIRLDRLVAVCYEDRD